jgi:outer membrane protein TolC
LKNQIDANKSELDSLNRIIKANQEALIGVREKYDADKARYRELTGR